MKSVCLFLLILFAVSAQELEVATIVAFTEGPTVDRDGNVYFTETMSHRIMKLASNGVLSTYRENSNGANGLVTRADPAAIGESIRRLADEGLARRMGQAGPERIAGLSWDAVVEALVGCPA